MSKKFVFCCQAFMLLSLFSCKSHEEFYRKNEILSFLEGQIGTTFEEEEFVVVFLTSGCNSCDEEAIERSVKKTGRCVVVHEATRTCGFGAELISIVQELCFNHLEAPIIRVTGWDTPYPHAQEWDYFPGPARVGKALKQVMEA